jgi:Regulator of Chromosome Condensation (RCC1) repeat protein
MKRDRGPGYVGFVALVGTTLLLADGCNALLGVEDAEVTDPQGQGGADAGGGRGGTGGSSGNGTGGTGGSTNGTGGRSGSGGNAGSSGQSGSDGGGPPKATQIAAGNQHTCATLSGTGEVRCWGGNFAGQLGDGTIEDRAASAPVVLDEASRLPLNASALALGNGHSCGVEVGARARCWGGNASGQLGDGTAIQRSLPVNVLLDSGGMALPGVQGVSLGDAHSCALVSGGEVRCWGGNASGQLGNNAAAASNFPVPVVDVSGSRLAGVQRVALGNDHSCALVSGGNLACWGNNVSGQLGDGTTDGHAFAAPVFVDSSGTRLTNVQAVALGTAYSCALATTGEMRCWGGNAFGQLGNGTKNPSLLPLPVRVDLMGTPLIGVQALSLGNAHACAVVDAGGETEVRCWGDNANGQLGDGTTTESPLPVTVLKSPGVPLSGASAVAAGGIHTCALMNDGQVLCWGGNANGQLGDGSQENRPFPTAVTF